MSRATPVSDHSLWWDTVGEVPEWDRFDCDISAEVCVVGGGFSGLTAALKLVESGASVVVLEAKEPGYAASGRNAGFVVPNIAKVDPDGMQYLLGKEKGTRLAHAISRGGEGVFGTARRLGIDCDAVETGWIQPVTYPGMIDAVHARFEQWKSLGRPVEWLDRVEIAKVMGCERFVGGWIDRSGGGIHPLKYLFGLGLAVRDLGGSVYSETPATGFQRSDGKWRVKTSRGEVLAETLLICANVSTGQLDVSAGASLMPARIYQMATKPLSKADSERLTPGRQPVSDVQNDVFTFRIDADNRLITGGMPIFPWDDGPGMGTRMARRLASELDLNEVPQVEKLWTGVAAVTTDFLPGIRQIGPGAFSGVACNARGIASTHVLGNDLAALALKGDPARDLTAIPVREIAAAPFRRLAPLATRSWLWWGRRRDRILARNAKTEIGNCRHVEMSGYTLEEMRIPIKTTEKNPQNNQRRE